MYGYKVLLFASLMLPIFAIPLQGSTVRLNLQSQMDFTLTTVPDSAGERRSRTEQRPCRRHYPSQPTEARACL